MYANLKILQKQHVTTECKKIVAGGEFLTTGLKS